LSIVATPDAWVQGDIAKTLGKLASLMSCLRYRPGFVTLREKAVKFCKRRLAVDGAQAA
jgi:hypothetical protein